MKRILIGLIFVSLFIVTVCTAQPYRGGGSYLERGGTDVPELTVRGVFTQTSGTVVFSGGNVGMGTSEPSARLDVIGDVEISGTVTAGTWQGTDIGENYIDWAVTTNNISASTTVDFSSGSSFLVPDETADPCNAGREGALFYNDTNNIFCFCNGTDDVRMDDTLTGCF